MLKLNYLIQNNVDLESIVKTIKPSSGICQFNLNRLVVRDYFISLNYYEICLQLNSIQLTLVPCKINVNLSTIILVDVNSYLRIEPIELVTQYNHTNIYI